MNRPPLDTARGRVADVNEFLKLHWTGDLSTIGPGEEPLACTVLFAVETTDTLVFKSQNGSEHSQALRHIPRASLVVYDRQSTCTEKHGVQLKGLAERIGTAEELRRVHALYANHGFLSGALHDFESPDACDAFIGDTKVGFYRFIILQRKLVDTREQRNTYSLWEPEFVTHANRDTVGFRPLCDFARGPVTYWAPQHRIVPLKELDQVNCPKCRREAAKLHNKASAGPLPGLMEEISRKAAA